MTALVCLCVSVLLSITSLAFAAKDSQRAAASAEFFREPVLRTINIQLSEAALGQLRGAPRSYVTGAVVEGKHFLTNVAIRLRGNGSFRSLDEKPSFAVKFDEFATNQTYRGLRKLMFNGSPQDSTYFAEFVARQLFRDAGLPGARVTHAQLLLNGRDLGIYVVVEAINRDFLQQHFASAKGNLYEANFTDINVPLEQDSGTPSDQADVRKLYQVCSITNAAERWRELPKVLDVEKFVSFAAMEMLTAHWDGYVLHTNNYRLYQDPKTGRFAFIPHGMDWAFLRPNLSLQVPLHGAVSRAVFSTLEGQALYRERVGTLFTNVFRVEVITNRIERELAKIRTGSFKSNQLAAIERGAAEMRSRVFARAICASNELAGVGPVPLKFDTNGIAQLTEWRADHDGGSGAVDDITTDGKTTLHITAAGVHCRPSWRSLVYLPHGSYRYEGKLRVVGPDGVLAMLRISGPSSATMFRTATDWRTLTYDFQVRDSGQVVEFVCDFSGAAGEAWFDLNSLRVRRLTTATESK
ncbi:MAG TPA: CotH kinase family protein [Verrucomicrobiae bacterium]